jgi:hypothetical protein
MKTPSFQLSTSSSPRSPNAGIPLKAHTALDGVVEFSVGKLLRVLLAHVGGRGYIALPYIVSPLPLLAWQAVQWSAQCAIPSWITSGVVVTGYFMAL